ncbi:hypothetical protein LINPERHAP2_LOCUS28575, partial [Linum perenne]
IQYSPFRCSLSTIPSSEKLNNPLLHKTGSRFLLPYHSPRLPLLPVSSPYVDDFKIWNSYDLRDWEVELHVLGHEFGVSLSSNLKFELFDFKVGSIEEFAVQICLVSSVAFSSKVAPFSSNLFALLLAFCPVYKKKKRGQRVVGIDKSGRGLRQFSMKDSCIETVESGKMTKDLAILVHGSKKS